MENTKNYNLNKPSPEDFYNIEDFNQNADLLDTELKKHAESLVKKADLINGKVPEGQLPSYVSAVSEHESKTAFPATGQANIIYIATDTGICYRWGGSQYVIISDTIALGETAQTAYRGDRGKAAYDHSIKTSGNPHRVTKTDVGLGSVDNTSDANKPVSTATQAALNSKANKPTHVKMTLTAANWNKTTKTYSFEATYPHAQYDVRVSYAKTCTAAQLDAWNGAGMAGDDVGNIMTAINEVPTVDIPVILEVTRL